MLFAVVFEGEFLAVRFLSGSTFGFGAGYSEVADCFHGLYRPFVVVILLERAGIERHNAKVVALYEPVLWSDLGHAE